MSASKQKPTLDLSQSNPKEDHLQPGGRLRSYLTQAWPSYRPKDRTGQVRRRTLFCLTGLFLLAYLINGLIQHRFPESGWARPLYLIHDKLFLWLDGTLRYWFYPWSLIWLVPGTCFTAYLIFCFLRARAFSQEAHVRFAEFWLHSTLSAKLLKRLVPIYARFGAKPGMLLAAADYRMEVLIAELTAQPNGKAKIGKCQGLTQMTLLAMTWSDLVEGALGPLTRCRRSLMCLLSLASREKDLSKKRKCFQQLAAAGTIQLLKLLACDTAADLKQRAQRAELFSAEQLGWQLFCLFQYYQTEADQLEQARDNVIQQLKNQVPQRRLQLAHDAHALQLQSEGRPGTPRVSESYPATFGAFWGAVALDLAAHLSLLEKDLFPLASYLDALEGLDLMLSLHPSPPPILVAFLSQHPNPEDYRFAACLAQAFALPTLEALRDSALIREGLLNEREIDWDQHCACTYAEAAGPELAPQGGRHG